MRWVPESARRAAAQWQEGSMVFRGGSVPIANGAPAARFFCQRNESTRRDGFGRIPRRTPAGARSKARPGTLETANPVLLRAIRGPGAESEHRGAYCAIRGGDVIAAAGDVRAPCWVRSGAKWFQAMVNLLSGAPERFSLDDRHLALMCASHEGQPEHTAAAAEMLAAGGLSEADLDCGAHAPFHKPTNAALRVAETRPTALHNNCSGKHAGMLLAALARGEPTAGYLDQGHGVQVAIRQVVQDLAEVEDADLTHAIDGCSAPTWILPLEAAARAYRNHAAAPPRLGAAFRTGARRLHAAVAAHPVYVGGEGRLCTALPEVTGGRVFGKVGAEGFYGIMIPSAECGVAIHVDSGVWVASERIIPHLLRRLDLIDDKELEALDRHAGLIRKNWMGREVGRFEVILPE